jgi:hypothetical protein
LTAPQHTNAGEGTGYSMGLEIAKDAHGHPRWGHSGSAVGGMSDLEILPDADVAVAVIVNLSDAEGVKAATRAIAEAFAYAP